MLNFVMGESYDLNSLYEYSFCPTQRGERIIAVGIIHWGSGLEQKESRMMFISMIIKNSWHKLQW